MQYFIRDAVQFVTRMNSHELLLAGLLVIAAGMFFLRGFVPRA